MSARLTAFRSLEKHPMLGKDFKKLSELNVQACELFIHLHDGLDRDAFAEKVNRWMLDTPAKPKHHTIMWGLVSQANTSAK